MASNIDNLLAAASSKDLALQIAIDAVEKAMKELALVKDQSRKAVLRVETTRLLEIAESIKKDPAWRPKTSSSARQTSMKPPTNSRKLLTKEEIILERAGFLNGLKFPRWRGEPTSHDFEIANNGELYFDEFSELFLSDDQLDVFDDWKRPIDAIPPPAWRRRVNSERSGPEMTSSPDIDLVQDAATDCSVVASLCAMEARTRRGFKSLTSLLFHPYDTNKCEPSLSKNGKYIIRLNFSGSFRKIVIDDRLPTSTTDRVIHVIDNNNPSLLWPALVEKAYLKVRGGYDFPGSNSGTDLWILTGWIPEQIFLQSDEFEPEKLWTKIVNGFANGNVLITLGTGKMSEATEDDLGLAGEHDYAVLDLREIDGQRLMLIKNPWMQGTSWNGSVERASGAESIPVDSPRDLLNADRDLRPGLFWMDLDNVIRFYESVYLNWNPGLFTYVQDIHFTWNLTDTGRIYERSQHASLRKNPQFTITTAKTGSVWVLLSRHLRNHIPESATPEQIEAGRHHIDLHGHITMAVFQANGRKVNMPDKHIEKGYYVDSPQTLLKLERCEANVSYTIVPLEQDLLPAPQTFTLSAWSNMLVRMEEAQSLHSYAYTLDAVWDSDTAGGNAQHITYHQNPQFSLLVTQKTNLSLLVEAEDPGLSVHVKLLYGISRVSGQLPKRKTMIRNRDIIIDSKEYRPACCTAACTGVDPGHYIIICSTYEQQQYGTFSLTVESSQPVQVTDLPRDGAMRVSTRLPDAIFHKGTSKLAMPLIPIETIEMYATVHRPEHNSSSGSQAGRSHILSTVEIHGHSRLISLSTSNDGDHTDGYNPARTDEITLSTSLLRENGVRECWLVLDRIHVNEFAAYEETFLVDIYTSLPNALEHGSWLVWDD